MNSKRLHSNEGFIKLTPNDLINKFRSKSELYRYLSQQCKDFTQDFQYIHQCNTLCPPLVNVNKDFLRQVFCNQKRLFKLSEIKPIQAPPYDELSVKRMHKEIYQDPDIAQYLPDLIEDSRLPDRNYFFTIINTVHPDYLPSLIEHAHRIRNKPQEQSNQQEAILMTEEWYDNLMKFPHISRQPGKTIHLLKQSTKFYKGKKQREQKEIAISLKRFKGEQENIKIGDMALDEEQKNNQLEKLQIQPSKNIQKHDLFKI